MTVIETTEFNRHKVVSSVIGGILSIEARDMDTKLLSAPESNNTLARCMKSYCYWLQVTSSGWPFVLTVSGLMTHLVASLTLGSARSCVMQGASFTHGKAFSIPIVFSWGGIISPDSFLPSIMLLVVIIVAVVIVVVTIVLVVVVGEGWANEFHQDKASSVRVLVANFTLQSSVQFLRENTDSVRSNQRMSHKQAFRSFEIERLAAHKLFIATFSYCRSFSWSGVPIGIISICHGSSLCFQSCGNTISN
ncbi:hypothetical protein Tco_0524848 [Tanacetum coccineum]